MSRSSHRLSAHSPIEHTAIRLSEDVVPPYIFALTFAVVVIVFLGIGWAWLLYHDTSTALGGFPVPAKLEPAPREIAGVNQTLIHNDRYGQRLREQQYERLQNFGWVDRDQGLVHIPIDEAMRMVVEEARR